MITVSKLQRMKEAGEKITMLTAYDYPMARLVDDAGVDLILVGDSVGNTTLGYKNTTAVTMEDMLHHTKAVVRGTENALVVSDMPFLACSLGVRDAVLNAGRLIREGGAKMVKLEGGIEFRDEIAAILRAGIPVMAHIGLLPQSVNRFGYAVQGKEDAAAEKIMQDALELEKLGVSAVLMECVPAALATKITKALTVPTIGIGAGSGCDGQVLVLHDMLGLYQGKTAKFVKQYASLGTEINRAVGAYIDEVKNGVFPDDEHAF